MVSYGVALVVAVDDVVDRLSDQGVTLVRVLAGGYVADLRYRVAISTASSEMAVIAASNAAVRLI
jgi:hypothetical protein